MDTLSARIRLTDLPAAQPGAILEVEHPKIQLALMRLGVAPGDTCRRSLAAPFGDPIAFSVNGTQVALRRKDAARIWVQPHDAQ